MAKPVWKVDPATCFNPRHSGNYPWPCASEPGRTIELLESDVLTRHKDGAFMKHTGLGCFGIHLKPEEVVPAKPGWLQLY